MCKSGFSSILAVAVLLGSSIAGAQEPDNGPIVPAKGIELVRASDVVPAAPTHRATPINLDQFNLAAPAVAPYAQIRASREGSAIVLRPNETQPANSFGWIEGPTINAHPGGGSDGDNFVFIVNYSYTDAEGTEPTLRARVHTNNFTRYAQSGQSPANLPGGSGTGTLKVHFDRNQLSSQDQLRLYVDLLSVYDPGTVVSPNYEFRITGVSFEVTNAAGVQPGQVFRAVYMEDNNDLWGWVGNSRQRLRTTVSNYAYDGAYAIAIDDGDLFAFKASNPTSSILVEDDDVISEVALAGQWLAYRSGGSVVVYDIESGNRREIVDSGANGVASGGDRRTFLILDSGTFSDFDVMAFDATSLGNPLVELETGNDIERIRGRMTHNYN